MSAIQNNEVYIIEQKFNEAEPQFEAVNSDHGMLCWSKEKSFAWQVVHSSKFINKVAMQNPVSLFNSLVNLGSIGLTLNPAEKLAYLVPRDGGIHLDISYRGLVRLATESGGIEWVQVREVCRNDKFEFLGVNKEPIHRIGSDNSFLAERGEVVGFYTVAKTTTGDYLCGMMSQNEVNEVRNSSPAYQAVLDPDKAAKQCPWTTHPIEMGKKTIVKRDSKMWPMTDSTRFMTAVQVDNEINGIKSTVPTDDEIHSVVRLINDEQEAQIRDCLEEYGIDINRVFKYYEISQLGDLPEEKYQECIQIISHVAKREKENINETAN